jgi:hypothetical protein
MRVRFPNIVIESTLDILVVCWEELWLSAAQVNQEDENSKP